MRKIGRIFEIIKIISFLLLIVYIVLTTLDTYFKPGFFDKILRNIGINRTDLFVYLIGATLIFISLFSCFVLDKIDRDK